MTDWEHDAGYFNAEEIMRKDGKEEKRKDQEITSAAEEKGQGKESLFSAYKKDAERIGEMIAILKKNDVVHGFTPQKLCAVLEDLGATYIKLGQIMSMRPDILPKEYCQELTKLRSDVLPMDYDTVIAILEEELKRPVNAVFQSVDRKPLGSASVAQAHAAVMKNGEKVVIKVQRRGLYENMEQDISILKKAGKVLKLTGKAVRNMEFDVLIDELWRAMKEELDFKKEAANLTLFAENQKNISYVTSPKVYQEASTEKILTMSCIGGIQIDDLDGMKKLGVDPHEICEKLAQNYCKQVIDDHFYHGDPHPGNIKVENGRVAWIDLGMMGRVSNAMSTCIIDVINSIVGDDTYALTNALFLYCRTKDEVDRTGFSRKLEGLVKRYKAADFGQLNLGQAFQEIMDATEDYNIEVPGEMTVFTKSLVTIEGTIAVVSPDINLLEVITAYMKKKTAAEFDPMKELETAGQKVLHSAQKAVNIPTDLMDIMQMLRNGDLSVRVENTNSQKENRRTERHFKDQILSILMIGLYLLAGLTISAEGVPKIAGISWVSFAALVLGTVCLIAVFMDLMRKNKE